MTGSSVACAATIGSVALPYFSRTNYPIRMVMGSLAAGLKVEGPERHLRNQLQGDRFLDRGSPHEGTVTEHDLPDDIVAILAAIGLRVATERRY